MGEACHCQDMESMNDEEDKISEIMNWSFQFNGL